ncbi:MAG: UDP-N-acetylmuramate dehydrogenase [Symploca sp. SIO2C1]|nr:UDP-N-acetylmuramate dehydrogenase [Symploca sp. SIO2C1]
MTLSYNTPQTSAPKRNEIPFQPQLYLPGTYCPLQSKVPLASLTSFRVGGPAEWYVAPRSLEDLQASFEWVHHQKLPMTLLGAGSNLLVSDQGLPGLVICTRYLRHIEFDNDTGLVTVGAGEPIARLAWQAAKRGWQGMEWAVGIPGTVGGAVVMNAGAHNSCTADLLVNVETISRSGMIEKLTPQELGFSYRTSNLQGGHRLVTQATFQLKPGVEPKLVQAKTSQHLEKRRTSQPYHLPSCGSVFRNPDSHAAAWLIEQIGLKGYQIGGAQVAQRHANFILNCGGAQANDIFQIIRHVQQQVEHHWSVWLEPEVRILGEFQLG